MGCIEVSDGGEHRHFHCICGGSNLVSSVYIPATTGYFNVGEIMVYTSASWVPTWALSREGLTL